MDAKKKWGFHILCFHEHTNPYLKSKSNVFLEKVKRSGQQTKLRSNTIVTDAMLS